MKRTALILACVLLWLPTSGASSLAAQAGGGWTSLFDGKTLKGWDRVGDANWEVVDGVLQANKASANSYLVTPMSYTDFQITLDFWVTDDANSGVFLRCQDIKNISQNNAYEVNIFDTRPDQAYRTGGIVDVAKPASVVMTGGKWNSYDITARGSNLTVILNGIKMVDITDTKHAKGPIALQYGAGTVKFRNVRIRTL